MEENCECNPKKAENEICEKCGRRRDECVCENMEAAFYEEK